MKYRKLARAYTLVEVVVVVTLLGVLIGMAVPSVAAISAYTRDTQAVTLATQFASDARRYAAYAGLSGNPQQSVYVEQAIADVQRVDTQVEFSDVSSVVMSPSTAALGDVNSYRLVQMERDGSTVCISLPATFTASPIVTEGTCGA